MANRRMFSRTIIESGEFEDLSPLAQLLYFRMGMIADDDGFAEGGASMRAIGAAQETLDELESDGFLTKVPGKKRLYHIRGWRLNNSLEPKKYNKSPYFDKLQEMYPDKDDYVSVLPAWSRKEYLLSLCVNDGVNGYVNVNDGVNTDKVSLDQDSIVQDRLCKYSIDKGNSFSSSVTPTKEGGMGEGNKDEEPHMLQFDENGEPIDDGSDEYLTYLFSTPVRNRVVAIK